MACDLRTKRTAWFFVDSIGARLTSVDYRALLNQVQKTVSSIEAGADKRFAISTAAQAIAENFSQLGIVGGRLWEWRDEGEYELVARFGETAGREIGIRVPADYIPMARVIEEGAVVMTGEEEGLDRELEERLNARRFAAISVGDENYVLSFSVSDRAGGEDLLISLNLVRQAINNKIRRDRFEALIDEAKRIQQSILPQRVPQYKGYDIHGRSVPVETVSGDFYDYIPVTDSILGIAIADASGHGLPAALIVRDIYVGLRMGVDRDFKIVRTVQKLNEIIHRARLSTKFVTMFYGELEANGTFIYTNAGHNPPIVVRTETTEYLPHGGPVLGPTPNATFNRGYVGLRQGDVLCLFTDGITEALGATGEEFGLSRLEQLIRENRDASAQQITDIIFRTVEAWCPEAEDDRTVVIVKGIAGGHLDG